MGSGPVGHIAKPGVSAVRTISDAIGHDYQFAGPFSKGYAMLARGGWNVTQRDLVRSFEKAGEFLVRIVGKQLHCMVPEYSRDETQGCKEDPPRRRPSI